MKYILSVLLILFGFGAEATQWSAYPTTATMAGSDTFLTGNGTTNQQLTAANFGISQTIPLINTSSNLIIGNAQTAINTSSNSLFATTLTTIAATNNSVVIPQINSSSNQLFNVLPARTNFYVVTNATAGNAVVVVGPDVSGNFYLKGTNWTTGGITDPLTNNFGLIFTNKNTSSTLIDSNAIVTLQTNGVATISLNPTTGAVFNTGTSNWFGGISFVASNAAPSTLISPSGLNSITMNQRFTNNFNRMADLEVQALFTDAATGNPLLGYTNTVTGQAWTNAPASFLLTGTSTITIVIPDISPNDFGSFSNYSGTGASVTFLQSWWHLK